MFDFSWASTGRARPMKFCLVAADGKIIGERAFAHGGAGLAEMCDWLVTTSGAEPPMIAVAIEAPHGPIVEILLERRFQVDGVKNRNSSTASAIASPSPAPKTIAPRCLRARRRLADRPALLPPARGRRPARGRAALVVAHGRRPAAGAQGRGCGPLRKRDYHALRTLSGVAPVTRRSG